MSRTGRPVVVAAGAVLGLLASWGRAAGAVTIASPGGNVAATIWIDGASKLQYNLFRDGKTVLEASPLGITVDGVDLGAGVVDLAASAPTEVNTAYPWRGVKSIATNHYNEIVLQVSRSGTGDSVSAMIWRAYDDGIAYRYQVPGSGTRTVNRESSGWTLPPGATMWFQPNTANYEGEFAPMAAGSYTWNVNCPTLFVLPGTGNYAGGYAVMTEGAVYNYSGTTPWDVYGVRTFQAAFLDSAPVAAVVSGGSYSPWRITITSATLNGIVNSTLVPNVNPEPSPALANASWIKPGRSVWSWWSDGNSPKSFSTQKQYVDYAQQLGFEYSLVDDGWETWTAAGKTNWDLLRDLVNYAAPKNVGIWVWKNWSGINAQADRLAFFQNVRNAGAVGVKIDFMNSESQSMMLFYENTLIDAASYQLMVNFHGANKPAGESRTYPNELTREGIRGLEYNIWGSYLTPTHDAALPFTRLIAGHADYTPVTFLSSRLGATTYAHQLAMAFVLTSPVTHFADDPSRYLSSPALNVIKAAPTVWDETVVLNESQVGELAAFARRKGDRWFLAIVNGNSGTSKTFARALSFLDPRYTYNADLLADATATPAGFNRTTPVVRASDSINVWLRAGGGFVGMFAPTAVPLPVISRSPAILTPSALRWTDAGSETFTVWNSGGGTLDYSIAGDAGWMTVRPANGSATWETDTIAVDYATAGLAPGTYSGTITISAPSSTNKTQTIGVTLTIAAPARVRPDFDGDGDVDMEDFSLFQFCYNGPSRPATWPGDCAARDFDGDGDVDLADFAVFQGCFNGPNRPPTCSD